MAAPHVTITVTGSSGGEIDPIAAEANLYMMYVEAKDGDKRYQWIVFPPALAELGVDKQEVAKSSGRVRILARTQDFPGNRSKWFHKVESDGFLTSALQTCLEAGNKVSGPVLVPVELDDYLTVCQGETSHKAIRAVDRALITTLNTTIKGTDK